MARGGETGHGVGGWLGGGGRERTKPPVKPMFVNPIEDWKRCRGRELVAVFRLRGDVASQGWWDAARAACFAWCARVEAGNTNEAAR